MHRMWLIGFVLLGMPVVQARAYVEAPHTLGLVCRDSSHIVLVEVAKINREKNLIIFKKLKDLKGMHPTTEIKHNIGRGGFHPREWQNVMNWAEEGKKAIFFHNGGASETCLGTYWYQCYNQGEWWGLSHGEPFLLRTFYGNIDKLAEAVTEVVAGREVIVTCLADGDKNQLHERKGKLQRLRASLKRIDYNAKRDFVALGGDGEDYEEEFRSVVVLPESSPDWRFAPTSQVKGDGWIAADFDDANWRTGKAPIGYGEEELKKRGGAIVAEIGQPFCFRRAFEVPASMLLQKGLTFKFAIASDNSATVYVNGQLADREEGDHEFAYWNREVDVPAKLLRPGKNVVAVLVTNSAGSSDLYLDMEISAQVPLPKRIKPIVAAGPQKPVEYKIIEADKAPLGEGGKPTQIAVDKGKKTVTLPARIAPRKLPNLNDVYPIEVIATYPAPRGQKAHETVISFTDVRPSDVQRALNELGLKPGKPARGENAKAEGPTLKLFLEFPGKGGDVQRLPIERTLVMRDSGKPVPELVWHYTGSSLRQPDPEKNEAYVGADVTGTLISLFPVTDDTIIQSALTLNDEPNYRLETNTAVLPPVGTEVRLVIVAN